MQHYVPVTMDTVKSNNTPTTKAASNTIRDFLAKNAAFQPQPGDAVDLATDDEVIVAIVVHENCNC